MGTAIAKKKTKSIQKSKPITLNREKRKILISILPQIVDMKKEKKVLNEKENLCKKLLTEYFRNNFPDEEMNVLAKYGLVLERNTVSFYINGKLEYYPIEKTVVSYNYESHTGVKKNVPENLWNLIEEIPILRNQISRERIKKINAYTSLINASKTIDDLKAVWLDVEDVIATHLKKDPVVKSKIQEVFSKEEAEVIIKDVKERMENND